MLKNCATWAAADKTSLSTALFRQKSRKPDYGLSESHDFGTGAAVCQKNSGRMYVPQVCESLGLSPGKVCTTVMERERMPSRHETYSAHSRDQRNIAVLLKANRGQQLQAEEISEGVAYSSSCGLEEGG